MNFGLAGAPHSEVAVYVPDELHAPLLKLLSEEGGLHRLDPYRDLLVGNNEFAPVLAALAGAIGRRRAELARVAGSSRPLDALPPWEQARLSQVVERDAWSRLLAELHALFVLALEEARDVKMLAD